jgi:hypothetical protein
MTSPLLNAGQPIVDDSGKMAQAFRTWTLDASLSIPIVGTGSPEGVVEARQFQLYINSAGTAGLIEYRKIISEIGGDRKQGWILV